MKVTKILQDGNVFDSAVLDLSMDLILTKFRKAVKMQSQLALGSGVPSKVSAPHSLLNAFKNLVAVSAASGYEFKQGKALLDAAKNAPAAGPAAPAAGGAAKVEEKKEEKEEEEEQVDMGNLFGDEDDY